LTKARYSFIIKTLESQNYSPKARPARAFSFPEHGNPLTPARQTWRATPSFAGTQNRQLFSAERQRSTSPRLEWGPLGPSTFFAP
jgi:hypothetical protein